MSEKIEVTLFKSYLLSAYSEVQSRNMDMNQERRKQITSG